MSSKKIVSLSIILVFLLSACAVQPTSPTSIINTSAPEFQLDNTSGGQTKLSDYQGSPVLLFFHMAVG